MNLRLIIGPPGCGKTTHLVDLTRRAVDEHGRHGLCIASMTRTAANHIATRAAAALSRADQLPDEAVGTLHSHAFRTLGQPALAETREGVADWNRAHPARRITANGLDHTDDPAGRAGADRVHAEVVALRNRCVPESAWTIEQRAHHQAWTDYKQQTHRLDFTDLIEQATGLQHPMLPRTWLIDEAQDLSVLELRLALAWIERARDGVLVADPDQTVFAWRGASPDTLLELPYTERGALTQSYRVPGRVHASARAWIRRASRREDVAYEPTPEAGGIGRSALSLRSPEQVARLAGQVAQDRTVMLLGTTRRLLHPVVVELARQAIPFHNPYRPDQADWNPIAAAGPLVTYTRAHVPGGRDWTWGELAEWTEALDARKALAPLARETIQHRCTRNRFAESEEDDPVTLDELLRILGCRGTDLRHPALVGDLDWFDRNTKSSWRRRLRPAVALARHHGSPVLHQEPRVTVGTVHSVKGGEAEHVIVAPDISRAAHQTGWAYGSRHPRRDPLLRLGYVALTRASRHVTVLSPAGPEFLPLRDTIGATA